VWVLDSSIALVGKGSFCRPQGCRRILGACHRPRFPSASASRRVAFLALSSTPAMETGYMSPTKRIPVANSQGKATGSYVPVYRDTLLALDNWTFPLSLWYPLDDNNAAETRGTLQTVEYSHFISVQKIAKLLAKLSLPPLGWTFRFPGSAMKDVSGVPPSAVRGHVVLIHGYLGSRLDMLHLAEQLSSQGYVVAAPEMPWSLSNGAQGSEEPPGGTSIVQAVADMLDEQFGKASLAFVGHSLGARVVAGVARPDTVQVVVGAGSPTTWFSRFDPKTRLLVVSSRGDRVAGWSPEQLELNPLPKNAWLLESQAGEKLPETLGMFPNQATLLLNQPCHISFLSSQTNDAMVSLLGPLLPLARLLGVPVLDFDRYLEQRDSDVTASTWIPVTAAFIDYHVQSIAKLQEN